MKQINLLFALVLVSSTVNAGPLEFLFGSGCFGMKSGTTGDTRNIIQRYVENKRFLNDTTWKTRVVPERNPNYLNDVEYMEESKYVNSTLGLVDTRFDKEFDTQIFFTATAKPKADGTIPVVDPDAKALVVYFHGSGTMKASGVGFAGKMNSLAKLGYSTLSFDLPFHRLGSHNPALADSKNFAEYVNKILEKYKVPGQKVILVGHSFGPDVIAEYITRFPHGADSAVLVSPGSFDKVTEKWYADKTSKMDFGDTEMNDAGGRWAGMVTNGKLWANPSAPGRVDPTKANPDLDIYVISGDREEYVPGKLGADGKPTEDPREYDVKGAFEKNFSRVDVTIEPGVGHYIFNHRDAQGQDVVMRSVLRANGESLLDEKELKKAVAQRMADKPAYDIVALRYSKEPFFKNWLDRVAKEKGTDAVSLFLDMKKTDNKKDAQGLLGAFMTVERQRIQALNNNIKATQKWAPAFYAENKAAIDALGEKGADTTVIQSKYLTFIKTLPEYQVADHASTADDVYKIPEKPQRPEYQPGQNQQGDKQSKKDRKPSKE